MSFDTLHTADYSPLVVHFTKGERMVREDVVGEDDPLFPHRLTTARERLINILLSRTIHASPMPFLPTEQRAVCFTECIWDGLNGLADHYSPYGVVFSKRLIFDGGGGPALYLRGDTLVAIGNEIPQQMHAFIAPFDPEARLRPGVRLDWLQEREWRLPGDLRFEYAHIEYVLVESVEDASAIVHEIGAHQLPENRMIPMEVYRNIKTAWAGR
jgi:hypothetical protein